MVEIQTHDKNITSTTLVLHMLQEIEQIAVETRRIIMEMRKFAVLGKDLRQMAVAGGERQIFDPLKIIGEDKGDEGQQRQQGH